MLLLYVNTWRLQLGRHMCPQQLITPRAWLTKNIQFLLRWIFKPGVSLIGSAAANHPDGMGKHHMDLMFFIVIHNQDTRKWSKTWGLNLTGVTQIYVISFNNFHFHIFQIQIQIQISLLLYISISTRQHKHNVSKYISELTQNHPPEWITISFSYLMINWIVLNISRKAKKMRSTFSIL